MALALAMAAASARARPFFTARLSRQHRNMMEVRVAAMTTAKKMETMAPEVVRPSWRCMQRLLPAVSVMQMLVGLQTLVVVAVVEHTALLEDSQTSTLVVVSIEQTNDVEVVVPPVVAAVVAAVVASVVVACRSSMPWPAAAAMMASARLSFRYVLFPPKGKQAGCLKNDSQIVGF